MASAVQRARRAAVARADAFAVRRFSTLAARKERSPEVDAATLKAFRRLAETAREDGKAARRVRRTLVNAFHRLYYHSAKRTWQDTRFLGTRVWKSPFDLWLYQEMLHELRPDVLVEAGTKFGGSAFYFAHLMDLMDHGRVVTIDVTRQRNRPEHPRITYLDGSSADPAVAEQVDALVGDGKVLVVLDSDHSRDHVLAELRLWAPRVPVGSYVVVEDTHADGHPVTTRFGAGPMDAVDAFLAETDAFEIDASKHKYFMSFNRRGYLRRVK